MGIIHAKQPESSSKWRHFETTGILVADYFLGESLGASMKMNKRVALVILLLAVSASPTYAQKKKPRRTTIIGSRVAEPSKDEVAGKLDAEDEYAVYSSLIVSLFGDSKEQSLVVRRLSRNSAIRDFADPNIRLVVKSDFPKLDYKTLDDFVSKNAKSYELSAQRFDLQGKIILATDADSDRVIAGAKTCEASWKRFYRAYPTAKGHMIVTRVGFNPEKTQAFVYADYWSTCKEGEGQFYFLENVGGSWKVTRTQTMWTNRF